VSPNRRSEAILTDRVQSRFAQRRILCVDDNLLELTLRGKILELQGYSVVLLSGPKQALGCDLSTFDLWARASTLPVNPSLASQEVW
jgi:hypothetical protein